MKGQSLRFALSVSSVFFNCTRKNSEFIQCSVVRWKKKNQKITPFILSMDPQQDCGFLVEMAMHTQN